MVEQVFHQEHRHALLGFDLLELRPDFLQKLHCLLNGVDLESSFHEHQHQELKSHWLGQQVLQLCALGVVGDNVRLLLVKKHAFLQVDLRAPSLDYLDLNSN